MPALANTAVSVSVPKALLVDIDKRAAALELTRSQYLILLARQDLRELGPLIVRSSHATPHATVELSEEAHQFLLAAIPALADYERRIRHGQPIEANPTPPSAEIMDGQWEKFLKERQSILENKWYRSGEAGHDIGIEAAIRDWLQNYAPKG